MRWLISTSILLILIGAGFVIYAMTLPVYTDANAPERLSSELQTRPRENRFDEWYSQLRAFETPHKKFADFGRGLCAAGAGLLLAVGVWILYHRRSWMRTWRTLFLLWIALWLARIPLTFWYYSLRQQRFDYPIWGDSIAIPIFSEWVTWIVGAVVSSILLAVLLIRHPLPAKIKWVKPDSIVGWIRALILACWIALLAACVTAGIGDGNEGMVLPPIVASVILFAFLGAQKGQEKK